jgi:hypothetical protein
MTTSQTTRQIQVGAFTITEGHDGITVQGPAAYMRSTHYAECIRKIEAGQSAVINYAPASQQDFLTLLGVAIQTDFAGWKGLQTLGMVGS